jgi:hypothetical protein
MPGVLTSIPYPGRHVKRGEHDPEVVLALQRRLNAMGCGPLGETGRFGADTLNAVRRFQARFPDIDGQPLKVDGVAGPLTWAALFGAPPAPAPGPRPSLATSALALARSQVGVRESPAGSNRGPEVDAYLRTVGLNPAAGSYAWCAAFVYWCFNEAARSAGRPNPLPRTAGVLAHWTRPASAACGASHQAGRPRSPTSCSPDRFSSWTTAPAWATPVSSPRCTPAS